METKEKIINSIVERIINKSLSIKDLVEISLVSNEISYYLNNNSFTDLSRDLIFENLRSKIHNKTADQIIEAFENDKRVNAHKSIFVLKPKLIDFILSQNQDIDIFLIERNKKLDIAFKHFSSGKYFHIHDINVIIEMVDFNDRVKDFLFNNMKKDFDTLKSSNGYGSPIKITIPYLELFAFKSFEKNRTNPKAILYTAISNETDPNKGGRVTLVMRFAENDSIVTGYSYDTFNLCPPTC